MSNDTTTVVPREGNRNLLGQIATETIIDIFSSLPNLRSVLALGGTSKRLHAILLKHEGIIARNQAIHILGDDDPGLVKLAFIACYACSIIRRSTEGVRQFLDAYVNRGKWPSQLYRLRALSIMPKINMGVELVEDWLATYGILWPVKLTSKCFTATESSRLRRHIFMLEAAVTILHPLVERIPEDEFQQLAKRYWETFSRCEVDAAFDVLWKFGPSHFTCTRWSACIGRTTGEVREHLPLPPYIELRQVLNFINLNDHLFLSHWRHRSPIFTALKGSHEGEREEGCTRYIEPFVDDPSAFFTKETATSELFKHEWGDLETHYNPQAIQWNILQRYFFMIGDKDRCEQLIRGGGMWAWEGTPQFLSSFSRVAIWHDDPVTLGGEGCVATWI
ncbi:hypothetical protein F4776DRAFT_188338 [Hypoxylon sp. NC0597]|nr:hypothetical protein F4776DRAFT_188338 [Hypoxylon sp. NC0597]